MTKKRKPVQVMQIKISLLDSDPLIWRRVLVPDNFSLRKFHDVIQIVMGWQNIHHYHFLVGDTYYTPAGPEFDDEPNVRLDTAKLSDVFTGTRKMIYEYDFGDGWLHKITLEKTIKPDESSNYPVCIGGENACPLEDCGGIFGYHSLVRRLNDPNDDDHDDAKSWVGGFFDPHSFDPNRINFDMLWTRKW